MLTWPPSPPSAGSRPCPPRVPSLTGSVSPSVQGLQRCLVPSPPPPAELGLRRWGSPDTFSFCSSPRAPCAGRGYFRGIYQGQRVQHHELVSWGGVGRGGGRTAPPDPPTALEGEGWLGTRLRAWRERGPWELEARPRVAPFPLSASSSWWWAAGPGRWEPPCSQLLRPSELPFSHLPDKGSGSSGV